MRIQDGSFLPIRHIAEKFQSDHIAKGAVGVIAQGIILPLGKVKRLEPVPAVRAKILRDGEGHNAANRILTIGHNLILRQPCIFIDILFFFQRFIGAALGENEPQFPGSNIGRPLYTGHFSQRLFLLLGIQCASCQNHKAQPSAQYADPNLRLLPLRHVPHPPFGVPLAEGKGHPGNHALVSRQPQ